MICRGKFIGRGNSMNKILNYVVLANPGARIGAGIAFGMIIGTLIGIALFR